MPSFDCSTAIRGAQGWICTARSLNTATKITAFVGSSTSDLRLTHKTYHRVDFQPIYTTPLESSSSDPTRAAMHRSKIWQFFHALLRAVNIALIISLLPSSEYSFSDLHRRKRIGLIGLSTRRPKIRRRLNHALHASLGHLLTSSMTSSPPRQHPRKP